MEEQEQGLRKAERLCSRKLIDMLFGAGGSHAMTAFPLKVVYRLVDTEPSGVSSLADARGKTSAEAKVQVMVSVPKKHFKRAVKRNRVKRQVREAYRKHKYAVIDKVGETAGKQLLVAFIWLSDELADSVTVEKRVLNLLERIGERI
ncbi:MAG: ribonuclease P protein component [Prevotella sp.]|nr:ribonuclease P protein component [Prevotella sp.]